MNKYDRQIRLWSRTGQAALQNSHLLVLGVTSATTEMVKCLVLSGVAHISLCDDGIVSPETIASNFFASPETLGRPIAEAVIPMLAELNPDITVDTVQNPDYSRYSAIIVANATTNHLDNLAKHSNVIEVCSFGFLGRVRSFYSQYTSYQIHPPTLVDLRFNNRTWPELDAYLESVSLENLDDYDHQNIPFVTILGKYAREGVPGSFAEKKQFKQSIVSCAGPDDDNWHEAANAAYHVWAPPVPPTLSSLFERVDSQPPTSFWIMTAALREFVKKHGDTPLSGVIPDMKTDTTNYLKIQQIYREKAAKDLEEFARFASLIAGQVAKECPGPDELRTFCKNCRHLLVIDGQSPTENTATIKNVTGDPGDEYDALNMHLRDVFIALELGCERAQPWAASEHTVDEFSKHLDNTGVLRELTRSGGGELNAIASIVGGMAAQEVTKLLLHQYTPIQHTLVYDGVKSVAATL